MRVTIADCSVLDRIHQNLSLTQQACDGFLMTDCLSCFEANEKYSSFFPRFRTFQHGTAKTTSKAYYPLHEPRTAFKQWLPREENRCASVNSSGSEKSRNLFRHHQAPNTLVQQTTNHPTDRCTVIRKATPCTFVWLLPTCQIATVWRGVNLGWQWSISKDSLAFADASLPFLRYYPHPKKLTVFSVPPVRLNRVIETNIKSHDEKLMRQNRNFARTL